MEYEYFLYRSIWPTCNFQWVHPTKQQLYGHLPPISKTIQVRRTRHAWHCWRSRDELINDLLLWTPSHGRAKAEWQARTYIQQLCEDTWCNSGDQRWTIGMGGERGSGISVLMARQDDEVLPLGDSSVNLRVLTMKEHSTLPKSPELESHNKLHFSVTSRTPFFGWALPLFKWYSQDI